MNAQVIITSNPRRTKAYQSVKSGLQNAANCKSGGAFGPLADTKSVARFWSKVQRGDGCWLWTACCTKCGYGQFSVRSADGQHGNLYAHRVAYELAYGPIPDGLVVRHVCDVPRCVNSQHLLIGTPGDNIRDAFARGRMPKQRPSCWAVPAEARAAAIAAPSAYGALVAIARRHNVSAQLLAQIRHRAKKAAAHV